MRAGFSTSSYLAVNELSRAGVSRPARTRGARAHAPVDVMNGNPLRQVEGAGAAAALRAGSNLLFQALGLHWLSPESGDL